jgi:hypothetical protein
LNTKIQEENLNLEDINTGMYTVSANINFKALRGIINAGFLFFNFDSRRKNSVIQIEAKAVKLSLCIT